MAEATKPDEKAIKRARAAGAYAVMQNVILPTSKAEGIKEASEDDREKFARKVASYVAEFGPKRDAVLEEKRAKIREAIKEAAQSAS